MVACKPAFNHLAAKMHFSATRTANSGLGSAFSRPQNSARYPNPQTGLWLSTDPAMGEYVPQAPINDDAKKYNQNLAGMGGVFNVVNLHVYHYAGNNPIRYTDPDGKYLETGWDLFSLALGLASFKINLDQGDYWAAGIDILGITVDVVASALPIPGGASVAIKAGRAALDASVSVVSAVNNIKKGDTISATLDIGSAVLSIAAVGIDIKGSDLLQETTRSSGTLAMGASNMPFTNVGSYGHKTEQARTAGTVLRSSSAAMQTARVVDNRIRGGSGQSTNSHLRSAVESGSSIFMPGKQQQYRQPNFGLMCQ